MSVVIGGILGFILGGPVGGVAGAAVGAALDRNNAPALPPATEPHPESGAPVPTDACDVQLDLLDIADRAASLWGVPPLTPCQVAAAARNADGTAAPADLFVVPDYRPGFNRGYTPISAAAQARIQEKIDQMVQSVDITSGTDTQTDIAVKRAWANYVATQWTADHLQKVIDMRIAVEREHAGDGSLFSDPGGYWAATGKAWMVIAAVVATAATLGSASVITLGVLTKAAGSLAAAALGLAKAGGGGGLSKSELAIASAVVGASATVGGAADKVTGKRQ